MPIRLVPDFLISHMSKLASRLGAVAFTVAAGCVTNPHSTERRHGESPLITAADERVVPEHQIEVSHDIEHILTASSPRNPTHSVETAIEGGEGTFHLRSAGHTGGH